MINNRALALTVKFKDLQRELSIIQARRDTEHDLSEEMKHQLWLEARQADNLIDYFLGGSHGSK